MAVVNQPSVLIIKLSVWDLYMEGDNTVAGVCLLPMVL